MAVYFIEDPDNGHIKIGKAKNVKQRFKAFQTANPNIRLIGTIPGYTAEETELHRRFAHARADREWFYPIPEILKLAKNGGKIMDFENQSNWQQPQPYPMPYQPPMPLSPIHKSDQKSERERAEERARKAREAARVRRAKTIDRAFWGFWIVMLLILFYNTKL